MNVDGEVDSLKRLKVVHVLNDIRPSGAETCLAAVGPALTKAGITSSIVATGQVISYRDQLANAGYDVASVYDESPARLLVGLFAYIRTLRPAVVHVHVERWYPLFMFVLWLAAPSAKRVRTVHNVFTPKSTRAIALRWLKVKAGDLFCDTVIACSEDVRRNEARFGRRAVLIENWVAQGFLELAKTRTPDGPMLILGNCNETKNHSFLLKLLRDARLERCVIHAGDESGAPDLEKALLDELDSNEWLLRAGVVESVNMLTGCSALLVPSLAEGMSIAMLEAIVVGVPVICSDVAGTQWVRNVEGSRVLPLDAETWVDALKESPSPESSQEMLQLLRDRFSPCRGAADLLGVYYS